MNGLNMKDAVVIEGEDFRRMQLLEIDMLVEFDRVCRANNIRYTIFGGSLLGAVRHGGFIPWDDDADITMLREDYELFRRVADQLDEEICFFQDYQSDPEYRWGYGKLRRTGTEYVRVGQEHLKCKTGVFVDVFPMDDIPRNVPCQILQDVYCACLRKILWAEVGKKDMSAGPFRRTLYSLLSHIDTKTVFKLGKGMERRSRNDSPNKVRALYFPATGTLYKKNPLSKRFGMPKSWFTDTAEYQFESAKLYGAKDYDAELTYIYGDYMKLPPEDERGQHSPVSSYRF